MRHYRRLCYHWRSTDRGRRSSRNRRLCTRDRLTSWCNRMSWLADNRRHDAPDDSLRMWRLLQGCSSNALRVGHIRWHLSRRLCCHWSSRMPLLLLLLLQTMMGLLASSELRRLQLLQMELLPLRNQLLPLILQACDKGILFRIQQLLPNSHSGTYSPVPAPYSIPTPRSAST